MCHICRTLVWSSQLDLYAGYHLFGEIILQTATKTKIGNQNYSGEENCRLFPLLLSCWTLNIRPPYWSALHSGNAKGWGVGGGGGGESCRDPVVHKLSLPLLSLRWHDLSLDFFIILLRVDWRRMNIQIFYWFVRDHFNCPFLPLLLPARQWCEGLCFLYEAEGGGADGGDRGGGRHIENLTSPVIEY